MLGLSRRTIYDDFVVIDSQFPQKVPLAFRNTEINEYLRRLENARSYTMYPMKPDADAWFKHGYGHTQRSFEENKRGYLQYYPENADRIRRLSRLGRYEFRLAYTFFLAETYVLLPFLEAQKIPFVFVLYPGGAFGMGFEPSDVMLRKIFSSEQFRGVIVTQQITMDYLLRGQFCPEEKVTLVFGGFVSFTRKELKEKKRFPKDKQTFDICFVAAKYSDRGVDKGYDLFVEVATLLAQKSDRMRFHVVGGFDAEEIPVSHLKSQIQFYGYQRSEFLLDLYSRMDIALSPNRPGALWPGNFDGFPLNADAAFCGAALFASDELRMNHNYVDGEDIVIVPLDAAKIAETIWQYYESPGELYALAERGSTLTADLFSIDRQIDARLEVFGRFTTLKPCP